MIAAVRRLGVLVACFALSILTGCSTVQDDGAFDVTLVNVSAPRDGGGLGEAAMSCTIRLQNATPDAIVVNGGAHKIYLNGVYIGQGLSNESAEVPRFGTATQEVQVYLSTFRLARASYRIYKSHTVAYRLVSTVHGTHAGHAQKFRAAKDGTVNVDELTAPLERVQAPSSQPAGR